MGQNKIDPAVKRGTDTLGRQPTVKDVALLAGVSPMTVSRTLSGGTSVRPEVQQRVHEAVRMLGYRKNENARSIRPGQTSGLVGVAITNIGNPYYGAFALGVEDIATEHGRRIILGTTGESPARESQLVADFIGRQVEGLIVVPSGGDSSHLQPDRLRGIPLVLASRTTPGVDADAVIVDDVGGSVQGTRALLAAGHTRIGFLGNATSTFTGRRRLEGFTQALREYGLEPDPRLVRIGQQDAESATAAAHDLLQAADPPTASFCANNRNAVGALRAIAAVRGDDPHRVLPSLVSFDSFELSELMPVPVTIVDHDARQLGRTAAQLLFERLDTAAPPRSPREIVMTAELLPHSTGR